MGANPGNAVTIHLHPLGRELQVAAGSPLRDVLFAHGVEFACGGHGRCKGCRVKVLQGALPITLDDERLLTEAQLTEGWRLSCRAVARENLVLELAQWEAAILSDDTELNFAPQAGYGIAVDLGTTTIVAQLLDLQTGNVGAVHAALNTQAQHGGDIMSRIAFAMEDRAETLTSTIRQQIGDIIGQLLQSHPAATGHVKRVVMVGNTVMHHLFCGLPVEPLSRAPFETTAGGAMTLASEELGWPGLPGCQVDFLPCLGGFVGSDILAGVIATRLHEATELSVFIDLGTNGEMVVGTRDRLLCASTAAGPAFEGARISMGMRAATGAISEVSHSDGAISCRVLGGGAPRGLCGSGLVDAIAVGLDMQVVQPTGRLRSTFPLIPPVSITQADVRELQLAKGAIAAGVRLLLERWGARPPDVRRVYLAGAFGNYINRNSAWRIGLIDFLPEQVEAVGNTALLGAKIALFSRETEWLAVRRRLEHVPLSDEPAFQDVFVQEMTFPGDRRLYSSSSRSL